MPNALAPTNNALNEPSAAFGFFPQLRRNRTQQDPEAAKDMPVQFGMGRGAATLGLPADIANIFRSPGQTEMFGETNYDAPAQFNWTTQHFQKVRPLQPTSPAGAAASSAGALLPLSPAEALQAARLARIAAVEAGRGGKAVLNMAGEELANRMLSGRSTIPGVPSAFAPSPLKFAVEPGGPRQELTNQMRELLAQRKLLQAGPEMNALNQQLTSLQQQFKEMPAVQRVAKEVVAPQVTAPVSNIGFYSAAEQASSNLARQSGTGEAFLNDLMKVPDVKKEELAWTGLDDFLRGKPNVTKKEVQDFIAANKVDVQEVRLGEAVVEDPIGMAKRKAVFDKYEPEIQAMYKEIDQYETNIINARNLASKNETEAIAALNREGNPQPIPTTDDWNRYYEAKAEMERVNKIPLDSRASVRKLDALVNARDAEANTAYVVPEIKPTKHERWQLPGGENYREILLTLPASSSKAEQTYIRLGDLSRPLTELELLEYRNARDTVLKETNTYRSTHFDQPNILAHMRVNDRIDAEGKKMLLIEEVQSDWHQAGRKQGYGPQYQESYRAYYTNPDGAQIGIGYGETEAQAKRMVEAGGWHTQKVIDASGNLVPIKIEFAKQSQKINEGVPDAPFKDTWHQVALKRALKYAADNGYERVGLTTGKQQIDRYSDQLRQNVSQIEFQTGTKLSPSEASELQALRDKPRSEMRGNDRARMNYLSDNEGMFVKPNETRINAFNGSRPAFSGTVSNGKFLDGPAQGKTVEEVLGSSIAKQIAEKPSGTISGENLSVGGEGMKKYYDEIYPAFLDKQSKKWNAKTGETTIGKKGTTEKAGVNYYQTPDTSAKVRYIDITPEMKGALAQGQPLHGLIPAIPAAGFGVEGMNRQQNSLAPPTSNALFLSGAGP